MSTYRIQESEVRRQEAEIREIGIEIEIVIR